MRKRLGVLFGLLGLFDLTGCAEPIQGALHFESDDGRSAEFVPQECYDGTSRDFLGVILKDEAHRVVEFFDIDGRPGLIIHDPGDFAFDIDPDECETFAGRINREFNRVTDSGRVDGYVELGCTTPDGWVVEGEVTFEGCKFDSDDECDHSH